MFKYINLCILSILLTLFSCANSGDLIKVATDVLSGSQGTSSLSSSEIASGLKQALEVGIKRGATKVSRPGGFFKNPLIKIPFPSQAKKAEKTLRSIGLGSICDKFVKTLNSAAEKASAKSIPIFVNAISKMTIKDAMGILKGSGTEATQFMRKMTTGELTNLFKPIIKTSLSKVDATKYWGDITSQYNAIPFTKKVDVNLDSYVTNSALDGLFQTLGQEEQKIRKDPLKRTTALLKKVFSSI